MNFMFKRVNENRYIVENKVSDGYNTTTDLITYVDSLMKEISGGDSGVFDNSCNQILSDSIMARIVSSEFIKNKPELFNKINYILVDVQVGGRTLTISVGMLPYGDKIAKAASGVLYG